MTGGAPLTRRRLLVRGTAAACGVASLGLVAADRLTGPAPRYSRSAFPEPGAAAVAVVPVSSYDGPLEAVLLEGLRTIGADVRGRSVLLKPNLVEFTGGPVNTDPRLVGAAVLAFRRLGAAQVVVGEGPGHRRDTEAVVVASGLYDVLRDVGARFVDLNAAPLVRRRLATRFTGLGELWLPRPVVDADIVVSMPKLKTHHWLGVTLSLKNCFGCVPGRAYGWPKNVLHWQGLAGSVVDVAAAVRPGLAIVDGIVGMEGDGPINGTPRPVGVVVLSADAVAADATGARLMGLDADKVGYLSEAGRFLGQARLERIEQRGEDPERSARAFAVNDEFSGLRLRA